jgi:hypothetical protein
MLSKHERRSETNDPSRKLVLSLRMRIQLFLERLTVGVRMFPEGRSHGRYDARTAFPDSYPI